MACSKIFSGDLPEITNYIIHYLRKDLKSLHSCILVNRHLCRITIPMLWEDPFSVKCHEGYPYNFNFLDIYLSFFNENDQTKLKDFGITINSPSFKNPLFNYPSFIKTLNTYRVELHIVHWMNYLNISPNINTKSIYSTNQIKPDKMVFRPTYETSSLRIKKRNLLDSEKKMDLILFHYSNCL